MEISSYDKNQILHDFNQLLFERKKFAAKIATKQEQIRLEDDKKIVEAASSYTVENIVKGLADLQLDFNTRVDDISSKLLAEVSRLEELRRAIEIETQHLSELRKIRIAAEALNILIQENEQKTKNFEEHAEEQRQALESEIVETKALWQKEQSEYEATNKERQERLKRERKKTEADFKYDLERKRKLEFDKHEAQKRDLERRLAEESEELELNWAEREKIIEENKKELEKFKALVETYPKELEDVIQKAKDEAIQEVHEKANLDAQLFEKEVEANKEVYELKIKSLEESIQKHSGEIEKLSTQFQEAMKQVQELALKTVESSEKITKSEVKQRQNI